MEITKCFVGKLYSEFSNGIWRNIVKTNPIYCIQVDIHGMVLSSEELFLSLYYIVVSVSEIYSFIVY